MGRSQLQGTPWHEEQMRKTCKEGSKYCIYNNNKFCSCKPCDNFNTYCVGKGNCDWFEPRTGTPKTVPQKTIIIKQNPQNSKLPSKNTSTESKLVIKHYTNKDNMKKESTILNTLNLNTETDTKQKETSEEKFLRLSLSRVNNIIDGIRTLGKLSNTSTYSYTDEQVEKMFSHIETVLQETKDCFKKKQPVQEFKWDE